MKRHVILTSLTALALLLLAGPAAAKVNLGLPSAVRNKVSQLKEKKEKVARRLSYKLSPVSKLLSAGTDSKFLGISADSATYRYSLDADEIGALLPGNIILSAPGGYMKKVVSVSNTGTEWRVLTTTAALDEAFETLYLEFHKTITPADVNIQALKLPAGATIKAAGEKFNLGFSTVIHDADGNYGTTGDQITTDLSFMFGISIDCNIDMPDIQHLNRFYLKINTEKNLSFGLSAKVGLSVSKEFPISPEISIPVWAVPPVTLAIEPKYKYEAAIAAGMDLTMSGKETSYTGIICDNDCFNGNNWRVESSSSSNFTVTDVSGSGEVSLSMGPGLEMSAKLADILGPFFELFVSGKAAVTTPLAHLPYTISLVADANGGIKAEIKKWFVNITFFSIETNLLHYEVPILTGYLRPDNAPVISGLTLSAGSITPGANTTISCAATDADNDVLTYTWSAAEGTFSTNGSSTTVWTAPAAAGNYSVGVTVSDNYGGSDQKSTNVVVAAAVNNPPVISSLTANPAVVSTGVATTITCAASDSDGDTLTYAWSAASGTISGSGSSITWTAPASSGTYSITCTVSDNKGGAAQQSVNVSVTTSGASTGHELPDTGQGESYTTTFGEDHDYQPAVSQPSYTDNGNGTTTDNRTGLMWVKDGASAGCNNGAALTWEAALTFCEGLTYAGYSDWRLPNVRELESIVDAGQYSPAINATYFPNTQNIYYWTSTTYVLNTTYAAVVAFDDGSVYDSNKTGTNYVRCVRAGP